MKVIKEALDTAKLIRSNGDNFIPLFTGSSGIAKSQSCQQWAQDNDYQFIDLRLALMEAPDLIGLCSIEGNRTNHNLPNFFPTSGRGLLLLEEPNRAPLDMRQALMQLLTDRQIHDYKLPEGWIIASCINPDNAAFDVAAFDAALKNRFVEIEVEYHHESFVNYMKLKGWNKDILAFIQEGVWTYKKEEEIGDNEKYLSPRTWEQLNSVLKVHNDVSEGIGRTLVMSVIGNKIGTSFVAYCNNNTPVLVEDYVKNKARALDKLKNICKPDNYQGDKVSLTIESFVAAYNAKKSKIKDKDLLEVALIVSPDQAKVLLFNAFSNLDANVCESKFESMLNDNPQLKDRLKTQAA